MAETENKATKRHRPDTKATDILLDKLMNLQKSPANRLKSPVSRKKVFKSAKTNSKLDKWISKPRAKNKDTSDELPSFKSKPSKKKQTALSEKYGVLMPSFNEIQEDRKKMEAYKAQVQSAQALQPPVCNFSYSPLKSVDNSNEIWLDCKHLSMEAITIHFKSNKKHLKHIMNGKRFSSRHQQYSDTQNYPLHAKYLTSSTSTIVFSFDQIEHILELMKEKFDPEEKQTRYFFQVLIPELCLKIFMGEHNMTEEEAVEYLDKRPID